MERYIRFAEKLSTWFGHAFAWLIMLMIFGVSYEVFVRYVLGAPTPWAFDVTYIMYGTLFMMAGRLHAVAGRPCPRRLRLPAVAAAHPGRGRAGALLPVLLPRHPRADLRRLEVRQPVLAVHGGQHHEPGEHPDLPVQDGDRGRRPAAVHPRGGAGLPLHPLPAHRRLAGAARGRRGARAGADPRAREGGRPARRRGADDGEGPR